MTTLATAESAFGQTIVSGSGFAREIKFCASPMERCSRPTTRRPATFSVDYSPRGGAIFGYGRNDASVDVAINRF